jgi:hypothetical protein
MAHHGRALELYDSLFIQSHARSLVLISEARAGAPHVQGDFAPMIDALLAGDADGAIAAAAAWEQEIRRYWRDQLGDDVIPAG